LRRNGFRERVQHGGKGFGCRAGSIVNPTIQRMRSLREHAAEFDSNARWHCQMVRP